MCDDALKDEPRMLRYVPDNLKSQGTCIKRVEDKKKKNNNKTLWSLFMDGVQLPQG